MKLTRILFVLNVLSTASFSQSNNHYWDLKNPYTWHLSSIPSKQANLFPESYLQNDLAIGYNRARISFYYVDPIFQSNQNATPSNVETYEMENHFVREVLLNEVYPSNPIIRLMTCVNLAYYPDEKGPYNFDVNQTPYSSGIDSNGNLNSPELRWGGIMRTIPTNIFTTNNLNYLGFWLMDPFVYDSTNTGGNLYINIGNVSEEILKDGRRNTEGGLPISSVVSNVDTTIWGRVTTINPPSDTFYDYDSRYYQDIGFDGLDDNDEMNFYNNYLNLIANAFGTGSAAFTQATADPSSDDFCYFLDPIYDTNIITDPVLTRYKKFKGLEGNTGVYSPSSNLSGITTLPDDEDINRNGIVDTTENYFQYKIVLNRDSLIVGHNFLVNSIRETPSNSNGVPVTWYKFLIPLNSTQREMIGNINNLDSSRFVRLFLKDFSKEVNLRFFQLEFVTSDLTAVGDINNNTGLSIYPNPSTGKFNISNPTNEINSIKVYDLLGKILYNSIGIDNTFTKIDLSELSSGVYFVEVTLQDTIYTGRVVIEK